jgi:hypothetical protein
MTKDSMVAFASTRAADELTAVAELREKLSRSGARSVIFYCSVQYDLERLGALMSQAFPGTLVGCTSAGQLGPGGFQRGGISALSVDARALDLQSFLLSPLDDCQAQIAQLARDVALLRAADSERRAFGLLLVDGTCKREEHLASALFQALEDVPLVGGSAGDDLAFEKSFVFHGGKFHPRAALFVLARTRAPFAIFKFQHFVPSATRLVVTAADPEQRIVSELNGEPAAEAYAEAIGARVEDLDAVAFSQNPLLVSVGGECYVRSVAQCNRDGSLSTFCAMEPGVVLSIGRGVDALATIEGAFAQVRERVPRLSLVLGFDCILRRLEFEHKALDGRVGQLLGDLNVFAFSTYGEQYNAVHVNQTFTGVAIGEPA